MDLPAVRHLHSAASSPSYMHAHVDDGAVAEPERGVRATAWPHIPLILIAIMTFILISSSGTMAMAVNMATAADAARPPR